MPEERKPRYGLQGGAQQNLEALRELCRSGRVGAVTLTVSPETPPEGQQAAMRGSLVIPQGDGEAETVFQDGNTFAVCLRQLVQFCIERFGVVEPWLLAQDRVKVSSN